MRIIPPKYLSPIGQATWKKLVPIVQPDEKTGDILALFCDGVSIYREAMEQLEANGRVTISATGLPKLSPWVLVQKQAFDQVLKAGRALGLEAKQAIQPDELDAFLANQGTNG